MAPHSTGGVTQQSGSSYCFQANGGICLKIHGNSVVPFSQYRRLQKAKCFMSGWKPNCSPQPKVSYWVIMMLYYSKRSVRAKCLALLAAFSQCAALPIAAHCIGHRSVLRSSMQRAACFHGLCSLGDACSPASCHQAAKRAMRAWLGEISAVRACLYQYFSLTLRGR